MFSLIQKSVLFLFKVFYDSAFAIIPFKKFCENPIMLSALIPISKAFSNINDFASVNYVPFINIKHCIISFVLITTFYCLIKAINGISQTKRQPHNKTALCRFNTSLSLWFNIHSSIAFSSSERDISRSCFTYDLL